MRSWLKRLGILMTCYAVAACAATGESGASQSGNAPVQSDSTQMAASGCMHQADQQRHQCEQKCPSAKGDEHFSMQHKLAMEHAACKQQCGAMHGEHATGCKMKR